MNLFYYHYTLYGQIFIKYQGMGKSYMESVILEEVHKLSKVLGFQSRKLPSSKGPVTTRLSWSHVNTGNPFNIREEPVLKKIETDDDHPTEPSGKEYSEECKNDIVKNGTEKLIR